jgi:acyl-CoA synthetase (NDP forming)
MSVDAMLERYAPLFMPKTVAVVGASSKGNALPNVFIRRIREYGFSGEIYPIHPTAPTIDGLTAYPSLAATPKPVDYAYIAVSGAQIPDMLKVAAGRVRYAQVVSSGFGEVDEGKDLQQRLLEAARAGGMRLLGPNCLGIYTPRGRITFTEISPKEGRHGRRDFAKRRARHRYHPARPLARRQVLRSSSPSATAPT